METVLSILEGTAGISILSLAAVFGFTANFFINIANTIRLGFIISLFAAFIVGIIYFLTPACNNPFIVQGSFMCETPTLAQTITLTIALILEMCFGILVGCIIRYAVKFSIRKIQDSQT